MAKRNYVLDTSVYLTDAEAVYKFKNNDIFIPLKVLEEIDKNKKRHDSAGINARRIIRILDELRKKGNLQKGVRIDKGKGILRAMPLRSERNAGLPPEMDPRHPDHIIIATALAVKRQYENRRTIVVTRDINMRVICDSIGMPSEEYESENVVTSSSQLYAGFITHLVDDAIIDDFYEGAEVIISEEEIEEDWFPNQYLMLVSNANPKKTALARFVSHHIPLRRVIQDKIPDWNIKAKNKEQSFAIDLLLDPNISLVTLVGRAGSGKTLCAIAAGLQQTLGIKDRFSRLIVSRPVQPLGKDIGFLPGTEEEKMTPWMGALLDNLEVLHASQEGGKFGRDATYDLLQSKIKIRSLNFMRGRTFLNRFIIIDEAQNLTAKQIKTLVTRAGPGTKIVCLGDIKQIDTPYLSETTSGLTFAVDRFKDWAYAAHITLARGERSRLAYFAAEHL